MALHIWEWHKMVLMRIREVGKFSNLIRFNESVQRYQIHCWLKPDAHKFFSWNVKVATCLKQLSSYTTFQFTLLHGRFQHFDGKYAFVICMQFSLNDALGTTMSREPPVWKKFRWLEPGFGVFFIFKFSNVILSSGFSTKCVLVHNDIIQFSWISKRIFPFSLFHSELHNMWDKLYFSCIIHSQECCVHSHMEQ